MESGNRQGVRRDYSSCPCTGGTSRPRQERSHLPHGQPRGRGETQGPLPPVRGSAFPGNRGPLPAHGVAGLRGGHRKDPILGSPKQDIGKRDLSGLLDLDLEPLHLGLQDGYVLLKLVHKLRGEAQQGRVRSPRPPQQGERRRMEVERGRLGKRGGFVAGFVGSRVSARRPGGRGERTRVAKGDGARS